MSNFNPFAPQAEKPKAPQLQGFAAPQANNSPGFTEQMAPSVFNKAMDSEAAGKMGTAMSDSIAGKWASLTAPAIPAVASPVATSLASGMGANLAAGGAEAAIASQAAAGTAATVGTAGGALAPAAAALGPFGIPILIGAGLYAANQGK
ncbi:MAG: hypothetical protein GY918_09060 [Gammaproteobacteria bacterium]|jgi:hypothetical protein|nr:hypothetical protein [Gammaproteobacteria bacterium]